MSDPGVPPAARTTVDRLTGWYPVVLLVCLLPIAPLTPRLPVEAGIAVFFAGTLVVGMAHGAVDHLVPVRTVRASRRRSYAAVGAAYTVLGGLVLLSFRLAPVAAVMGFVALTWVHWGQGDVAARELADPDGTLLRTRSERALTLVVRGGLPMGVPLVAHPDEYGAVLTAIVGLFDVAPANATIDAVTATSTRAAVGGFLLGFTLLSVTVGYRSVRRGASSAAWRRNVLETGVLWAWFLLAAPVFAIGVYFAVWHSLRHVGRLLLLDDRAVAHLASGDLRGAVTRFGRDAAPLTVGGYAVVAGVALVVPAGVMDLSGLLAATLVAIAALTLPHVAVTAWLDLKQGIW